jgi:predicted GNAT superfamily acetyltransferase
MERIIEKKGKRFLFRVEASEHHGDYPKYEELRNSIWEWPMDSLPGARNMLCGNFFHDGSSLFIGVFEEFKNGGFDESTPVGFAYGFVGVVDKQVGFRSLDNLQFYSQYTGVKKGYERYGLGVRIKELQKDAVMELLGIYTITCTYDPLTGVNAYRNVHHFGMDIVRYNTDIYGEFGGRLNRADVPSDRLSAFWHLQKNPSQPNVDLQSLLDQGLLVNRVEFVEVVGEGGPLQIGILKEMKLDLDNETLLLEIPFDWYRILKETDVADAETRRIPYDWRMKTRETFSSLFERGYGVIDFRSLDLDGRKRDFYVLRKRGE